MEKPAVEEVCGVIANLYTNPDPSEKAKANQWLQEFQNSVYAWKVCDEILHLKMSLESCYIAAQTMRTKIQSQFHEVPVEAHISLRDSLMEHIKAVDENHSGAILTQLCLALADLILLMPEWKGSVNDLIMTLQASRPWSLLEVLIVIPEEVISTQLRLGDNRRKEVGVELKQSSHFVNEFLKVCCVNANPRYKLSSFKCLASWLQVGAISLENIDNNEVMHEAFRSLANVQESPLIHEAAADCVIALLVRLEDYGNVNLEMNVFTVVRQLEEPYHLCVANEDLDKALNLCRVFTELAETFLIKMISFDGQTQHFAITILDNVLNCCGHPDYTIPEITFNFWYRLTEELYEINDDHLNTIFQPYIERLINSLCRHCQMETDCSGLLEDGEDFSEFRNRVVELIKDVVFVVGSANVFKHMLAFLSNTANSWETVEAALFIMAAVAGGNLFPNENDNIAHVMESILLGGQNQHMAVRYTSIRLLGELSDWVNQHPEYLERILNWLLMGLQEPRFASQAAMSLQNICSQCQRHMRPHFEGLVHILRSLDSFQLKHKAATGLIEGCAMLICYMPHDRIAMAMKTMIDLQLAPISNLLDKAGQNGSQIVCNSTSDPVLYLDRLAAIFSHVNIELEPGQPHPLASLATQDVWPILARNFSVFTADSRIMERTCRTLRFVIRCVGTQSATLVKPLVQMMVSLYVVHPHSCFLYLGSILVDEYAHIEDCVSSLLEMLRAFLPPTFALLNTSAASPVPSNDNNHLISLKNHPDTVDDFFRLNARFLQRATLPYLLSDFVALIIEFGLVAIYLDHKDANGSVMNYFLDLMCLGSSKEDQGDFEVRSALIHRFQLKFGPRLVDSLIKAAVFYLPSYTFHDIGCVLMELMLLDRSPVCHWLETSLNGLSQESQGLAQKVTHAQLVNFHKAVTSAEEQVQVTDAIREFSRLWR